MIGKRIVQSIIVVFIVTLLVFLLMQLVPGDPIVNFLGSNATEEQVAYYTELFGYDKPVLVQYGKWILGLFHGQMGRSVAYQAEISGILFQRLGITLSIVIPAFTRGKEARKQTGQCNFRICKYWYVHADVLVWNAADYVFCTEAWRTSDLRICSV